MRLVRIGVSCQKCEIYGQFSKCINCFYETDIQRLVYRLCNKITSTDVYGGWGSRKGSFFIILLYVNTIIKMKITPVGYITNE